MKNPPKAEPSYEAFGLTAPPTLSPETLKALSSMIDKKLSDWSLDIGDLSFAESVRVQEHIKAYLLEHSCENTEFWKHAARTLTLGDDIIAVLSRYRAYQNAKKQWHSYQHWLKERNPERRALEAACGYDSKNAMHLIRLLRMANEICETGKVQVYREDAEQLLEIRQGHWTYEQVLEEAKRLEDSYRRCAKTCTSLPDKTDYTTVQAFLREIHRGIINAT